MRNFYQSSSTQTRDDSIYHHQNLQLQQQQHHHQIKYKTDLMSCSFKTKSILPVPLIASHDSTLSLNQMKLFNTTTTMTTTTTTSSSHTKQLIQSTVCSRPSLNYHLIDNNINNNYTDLLPLSSSSTSSSSNESSSSLSSSLSIEANSNSSTTYLNNQQQKHKLIVKKNSSLLSKTSTSSSSSSSSSAYSSFGSTTSSPVPSPNSSNFFFNNNVYQVKQSNARLTTNSDDLILANNQNRLMRHFSQTTTPTHNQQQHHHHHHQVKTNKMLNDEQTDRFFESNTLYKKELKQKQREILTTSSPNNPTQFKSNLSTTSVLNDSKEIKSSTINSFAQQSSSLANTTASQLTPNNTDNILKSNSFSILSPQANTNLEPILNKQNSKSLKKNSSSHSSNKVLNLFSHFLNRNKSSSPSINESITTSNNNNNKSSENLNKSESINNYLNIKYLKRASSSSHFKSNELNRKLSSSKFKNATTTSSSPDKQSQNKPSIVITHHENEITDSNFNKTNKHRRSYDDVSLFHHQQQQQHQCDSANNSFNQSKFENTAFSTKNNGLIFIPSPKTCAPPDEQQEHEQEQQKRVNYLDTSSVNLTLNENVNNYENLENDLQLSQIQSKSPVKTSNLVNYSNELDDSAFDNAVYSYVDNLRHHSKRLSEINMFSHAALSAAAASNAAKAVINSSTSSSSSSSSSSLSAKNSTLQLDQLVDNQSSNQTSNERANSPQQKHENDSTNSFENQNYIRLDNLNKSSKHSKLHFNLNSPGSSLASSSSSSSSTSTSSNSYSSSSNASISPKSLSSSETVIINSNLINKTTKTPNNSHVMSLREKFEHFNSDSKSSTLLNAPTSTNRFNRNSAHILPFKLEQSNDEKLGHSLPIVMQTQLTSSMTNMSTKTNDSTKLVVSTSSIQINQTNSPVSTTMSSVSSLSDSFSKEGPVNPPISSSSSSPSDSQPVEETMEFNYFSEFYQPNDSIQYSSLYRQLCSSFIRNYYSSNSYLLQFILNPIIDETTTSGVNSFKFTLDYLKPFLKLKIKSIENNLNEMNESNEVDLDYQISDYYANLKLPIKELINRSDEEFNLEKIELKNLIGKKMNYFLKWLKKGEDLVEINNQLGAKLLTYLEKDTEITSLELDKYKLLVSESDLINNLSLKLSNKLANTENSIQIINLKHMQSLDTSLTDSFSTLKIQSISLCENKESNEEIELLKQELNQIQRKKEEALFLKNGIDKRAQIVSDFLKNYLSKEHYKEYEMFIQMKSVYAIQLRHIRDQIELTQLQLKLLNDLI